MSICSKKEEHLESILKKAIILIVVMAFMIPLITPKVFAASGVSISGGDSVKGGDTFQVTVTYSGDSIGRVSGQMTYDTNKLTYLSGGSSSGNSGYIQLSKAGTGEAITFTIKFQAVAEGSTQLQVTTNELYDLNEGLMDTPSGSKTVSIKGSAASNELITETASPDQPGEGTTEGLDEKQEEDSASGISSTMLLLMGIIIVLIIIVILVVILITKNKKAQGGRGKTQVKADPSPGESEEPREPEELEEDPLPDQEQEPHRSVAGRSAKYRNAKMDTKTISSQRWDDWEGYQEDEKK